MSNSDHFGSFVMGLFTGAIIGAVATILYTPKTGEETRSTLKEKGEAIVDKANLSMDDAYKQAENAAREARDKFENLATVAKQKAENAFAQEILQQKKTAEEPEAEVTEEAEILMPEEPVTPKADEPAE